MKNEIIKWMKEFVEQPNPKLGNWAPCPYARAARINGKIKIIEGDDPFIDLANLHAIEDWTHEVYVFWYPTDTYSPDTFSEMSKQLNKLYMPENIVILEDHPGLVEKVNGVQMNFGKASLLVVQRLDELNAAADKLRSKGYYDHWSQEEIDEVVTWRYK